MRVAVSCVLAMLALGLSGPASLAPASRCAAPNDHDVVHPKSSSFAPHAGPQSRVYGTPIQSRIFKTQPKRNPAGRTTGKKDPELRSSPLPAS